MSDAPGSRGKQAPAGDLAAGLACPLPDDRPERVHLGHGGGGRMSQRLIDDIFVAAFRNPALEALGDGALLEVEGGRLAFSTDSFVVRPRTFPGGDIGSLAVHGTVNDLAMCGARPVALSAGFILEEGLPLHELERLVRSMAAAAAAVPVPVVTGDTKVVDRGKGDGLYINTSGVGVIAPGVQVGPERARPGDVILVSGTIADHGMAIMSVREGLEFESPIASDSAALWSLVEAVLAAGGEHVHALRDPTRGGVASAVNEIAAAAGVAMELDEAAVPVREPVRGACEILGLDPLYVANEGKCLVWVAEESADRVLAALRSHDLGRDAVAIGRVTGAEPGGVAWLRSRIGGRRRLDLLSGEQLPRIC